MNEGPGSGDGSTIGSSGTGEESAGSSGTGDESVGSSGTGDESVGSSGTGDESTGGRSEVCPQGVSWVRVIETELPQDELRGLAVDAAGNSVIIGEFAGEAVDFGAGPMDSAQGVLYVANYGPAGEALWSRQFGAGMRGDDVAFDGAGNVVVTGSYWTTVDFGGGSLPPSVGGGPGVFIVKLSPEGEHLWSHGFAEDGVGVGPLAVGAGGEVAFVVESPGPIDIGGVQVGGANANANILRLAADGAVVWIHTLAGQGKGQFAGMGGLEFDAAGAVLMNGMLVGLVDFGGEVFGTGGDKAPFVARLDEDGEFEWLRQGAMTGSMWLSGMAIDDLGRIHVGGVFTKSLSFGGPVMMAVASQQDDFAALFDADGQHLWSDNYSPDTESGMGLTAMDANGAGERLLGGQFMGKVDYGGGALVNDTDSTDGFVVRQGPLGEHRWSRSFGGTGQMFVSDAAIDADGAAWIAGVFDGELIVGEQVITKAPLQYQIYVMKLCADG